jgi:hypothetical protein
VSRKDPSMTPERWDYLKSLKPADGRLVFLSKPLMQVPVYAKDEEGNDTDTLIRVDTIVAPFKGKTYVKPKTLESMLNLSKRQARKMRKRANNYLRAI